MIQKWKGIKLHGMRAEYLTIFTAVFIIVGYNQSLWQGIFQTQSSQSFHSVFFLISCAFFLIAIVNLLFNFFAYKKLQKIALIVIILCSASASYFMDSYNVLIDSSMLQNIFETDSREAAELLSPSFIIHMFLWGALPIWLLIKLKVNYRPIHKQFIVNSLSMVMSIAVVALIALFFYQDYASLLRNNRHLRYLVNPTNYLSATHSYVTRKWEADKKPIEAISMGVQKGAIWSEKTRRSIVVFVVGETARAQQFHLNGYNRQTTPLLEQENIINFSNVSSCGTATAISLPCMFSKFSRSDYDKDKGHRFESVLDVISDAGMSVQWRDNNSGCKGVCDRVDNVKMTHLTLPEICNDKECFDEVLLHDIEQLVASTDNDLFIALHQKGSHGPAYYERVPERFEQFTPVCKTNQLQDCSREEITNAYDNTILYTDYILTKVISFLNIQSANNNTAMIYASDHGESLGEKNLYLHGTPYFMAPKEQTHVPMMFWMSQGFEDEHKINRACLEAKNKQELSHDNLFHSILGMLDIKADVYQPKLDIFQTCSASHTLAEK